MRMPLRITGPLSCHCGQSLAAHALCDGCQHSPPHEWKACFLCILRQLQRLHCREIVFSISDVGHPEGIAPLQTFQARGRTLFLDEASFENKELLEKLTPPSPFDMEPDGSAPKKDDEH